VAPTKSDRPKIDLRKEPRPIRHALNALRYRVRVLHAVAWAVDRVRGENRQALLEAADAKQRELDASSALTGQVDWPGERRVGLERFTKALDELAARVRADGARLLLVSMPRAPNRELEAPVLLFYNQAVQDAAARLGAGFFDARLAVQESMRGPPARDWSELFLDAYHPTRAGHALIAAGLWPIVKALAAEPRANRPASGR
jgi:hypothetical protein